VAAVQYTFTHKLHRKTQLYSSESAGHGPSVRVIPWHLP